MKILQGPLFQLNNQSVTMSYVTIIIQTDKLSPVAAHTTLKAAISLLKSAR